jgi:hypothetical protein
MIIMMLFADSLIPDLLIAEVEEPTKRRRKSLFGKSFKRASKKKEPLVPESRAVLERGGRGSISSVTIAPSAGMSLTVAVGGAPSSSSWSGRLIELD